MLAFLLVLFLNSPHLFAQSPNYNIGDVITNPDGSKGVVFWLAPDGSGGWMCALNDVSGTYQWSTQSVSVSGFPALPTPSTLTWQAYSTVTADTAGYEHTQRLRAAGNATSYPAAYAVDFAHGWYLPAIGQLLKLYAQQATIRAALVANGGSEISRTNHYWSSTYATTSKAYYLYNPSGHWNTTSKSTAYYVRPVRSFTCRHIVYDTTLTYLWSTGATTPYAQVSPTASGTYTVTATSGFGCSNTAEVSVVVANGSSQTLYDTVCAGSGGYGLNGFNLSAAQTARSGDTVCVKTLSQGACSTTVTLRLHRKAPATATITASICPGECYYLNGMELCNAGTYVQHLTAANGCDSTLTLHLTVNNPVHLSITATTCGSYEWHGQSYTVSGVYTHAHEDANGCQQVDTLHLTINAVDTVRFNETVCLGEPYTGHGFNIPADSTMVPRMIVEMRHATSLRTGCDSCTILTLTISPTPEANIQSTADTICQGESATLSASPSSSSSAGSFTPPAIAIGDILCTDNSIVKPADWPVAGKTAMGVVFYVDNTKLHGWAVALKEFSSVMWGPYSNLSQYTIADNVPGIVNGTNQTDPLVDENGMSNTISIRAKYGSNFVNCEAAYNCYYYNHITGTVGNTHQGWYLPAIGQLRKLWGKVPLINSTLTRIGDSAQQIAGLVYLSSSEFTYFDNSYAYVVSVIAYSLHVPHKKDKNSARPIRNF